MFLYEDLTGKIIGAAMEVHRQLGPGFLEAVYENALEFELTACKVPFKRQDKILIMYKEIEVGEYKPDFIIDQKIILEIKAVDYLVSEFQAQVLNYLAATRLKLGLLLNFGAKSLQVKRMIK
jgi:GxxExxY protein